MVCILIQEASDTDAVLLRSLRDVVGRVVQLTNTFRGGSGITAAARNTTVRNVPLDRAAFSLRVPPGKLVVHMVCGPHCAHSAEVCSGSYDSDMIVEDLRKGVRLRTNDVVGAAWVVIYTVGRVEHARGLVDSDLEGKRRSTILAGDRGGVNTMSSEPGVDGRDSLLVRGNERIDFVLR